MKTHKEYLVHELFFNSYDQLTVKQFADLAPLRRTWISFRKELKRQEDPDATLRLQYGTLTIAILRILRRRPLLVDRITVDQAVDCMNDLKFLVKGNCKFPAVHGFIAPEEYMHNRTFDHFIYADHEFSKLRMVSNPGKKDYAPVAACLYAIPGQCIFNEDEIDQMAEHFSQIDLHVLQAIVFTFMDIREWLTERCSTLLSGSPAASGPSTSGASWKNLKQRTAELRLTWKDPENRETNYVGHARYLEVMDHLESISKRKDAA